MTAPANHYKNQKDLVEYLAGKRDEKSGLPLYDITGVVWRNNDDI